MTQTLPHLMVDPDDKTDWEMEAKMLYDYLIKEEDKKSQVVKTIMQEFYAKLKKEPNANKRKILYQELRVKLFSIRHEDRDFSRSLFFITGINKAVEKFENTYEKAVSIVDNFKKVEAIVSDPEFIKIVKEQAEEAIERVEEVVGQTERRINAVVRNDMFTYTNEERLNEFRKLGYELKMTYMIDDEKTANDSRYFNSLNQVRLLDENFEYVWEGKLRSFPYPKDRPNDRSLLIPYIIDVS